MHVCHFCKTAVENPREVFRDSTCPSCHHDLKICLNCRFYSPGAHWDCSETIDEPVRDKDRANFCSFFSFRDSPAQGSTGSAPGSKPSAKPDPKEQARRKLDKLFGDGT